MINFVIINEDEDRYEQYIFNCAEEILKIYWSNNLSDIPAADYEVFGGKYIMDNKVYHAKTFGDIIEELQINYWKNVRI